MNTRTAIPNGSPGSAWTSANKWRLDEKSLRVLKNAALLHDIGKIGVLESILNKAGKLDENEFQSIRKHPDFGDEILKPTASLREERAIVRIIMKEKTAGYPDGLTGDQLGISEKIIIVADAFDAMNSKRPYRQPLKPEVIRQELLRCRGTQFDRDVVSAFMEIFEATISGNAMEDIPSNVVPPQNLSLITSSLFEKCPFGPISALDVKFNPQNIPCIPAVKFSIRLELEQK